MARRNNSNPKGRKPYDNNEYDNKHARSTQYRAKPDRYETNFEKSASIEESYLNNAISKTYNDPQWWLVNRTLVEDATKLPMGNMVGDRIPLVKEGNKDVAFTLPGIMALHTVPTMGFSEGSGSALSRSAIAITEFMRSKLTTDESFDAPDVFMYFAAMDQISSLYFHIVRAFGLAWYYQFNNLYTPQALMKAGYGFTESAFKDLVDHRANYLARFNQIIQYTNQLYVPMSATSLLRHCWQFSKVFKDSRNAKSQFYIHRPVGFYVWNEDISEEGTMLRFVSMMDTEFKKDEFDSYMYPGDDMDSLLTLFERMIRILLDSTSQRRIRMALIKAYDGTPGWRLKLLDINYIYAPEHDDVALSQINNTYINPWFFGTQKNTEQKTVQIHTPDGIKSLKVVERTHDVTQDVDTTSVRCFPYISVADIDPALRYQLYHRKVMNFHWDSPNLEDWVEALPNVDTWEFTTRPNNQPNMVLSSMALSVVVSMTAYLVDWGDGVTLNALDLTQGYFLQGADAEAQKEWLMSVPPIWAMFDWAPTIYMDGNGDGQITPLQEFDNANSIDNEALRLAKQAMLTSVWQVPEMGLSSTNN